MMRGGSGQAQAQGIRSNGALRRTSKKRDWGMRTSQRIAYTPVERAIALERMGQAQAVARCFENCDLFEHCDGNIVRCNFWPDGYRFPRLPFPPRPARPTLRERLALAWRSDPGAVAGWGLIAFTFAYLAWHIGAAIVEGRLRLPL